MYIGKKGINFMNTLLALLSGVFVSTLVVLDGQLADFFGLYLSTTIIHLVGVVFALLIMLFGRIKFRWDRHMPLWFLSGGIVGVFATLFNNFSFGKISVTNIIALGLLGQVIFSLVIDQFGLFGLEKHKIAKSSLLGIVLSFAGIFVMLDFSNMIEVLSVLLSFAAGFCIVAVRSINARLGESIGKLEGALVHHIVGTIFSFVLLISVGRADFNFSYIPKNPVVYLGGCFGLMVVLIFNYIVPRLSAFTITVLSFLGQIGGSVALDFALGYDWNFRVMTGSAFLCVGIIFSQYMTHRARRI